jgi:hypothetical protein
MISFGRLRKKSMMCGGMVVVVVLTVVSCGDVDGILHTKC